MPPQNRIASAKPALEQRESVLAIRRYRDAAPERRLH